MDNTIRQDLKECLYQRRKLAKDADIDDDAAEAYRMILAWLSSHPEPKEQYQESEWYHFPCKRCGKWISATEPNGLFGGICMSCYEELPPSPGSAACICGTFIY